MAKDKQDRDGWSPGEIWIVDQLMEIREDIAALKAKSGIWGALGGIIAVATIYAGHWLRQLAGRD